MKTICFVSFLVVFALMTVKFSSTPVSHSEASAKELKEYLFGAEKGSVTPTETNTKDQPNRVIEPKGTEVGNNTFYGDGAGVGNSAQHGTFIGAETGAGGNSGDSNTFVGQRSGWKNSSGESNTFVGRNAGSFNTEGDFNTFYGRAAGYENTIGDRNTFIGYGAGFNNTTGIYNTFVGNEAGYNTQTIDGNAGELNTFIGDFAGHNNTSGDNNTFIGAQAGRTNSTGSGNVFLGSLAGLNETSSNKLYIDNSHTSQPLIWGDFQNDNVVVYGGFRAIAISSPSDARLKKNIKPLGSSLDKISALQGVSYEWNREGYPDVGMTEGKQIGLVAQNVEKEFPELVTADKDGYKGVSYSKLTAVLVEAVKELKAQNEKQKAEIEELRSMMKELKS